MSAFLSVRLVAATERDTLEHIWRECHPIAMSAYDANGAIVAFSDTAFSTACYGGTH